METKEKEGTSQIKTHIKFNTLTQIQMDPPTVKSSDNHKTPSVTSSVSMSIGIPDSIISDPLLQARIGALPSNYNFEIEKSIWRIKLNKAKVVALQFPEGLLIYSCIIADILTDFAQCECIIMGDVTYGACCVDDFSASEIGASFLIHYGHSCLIPINQTSINMLYVFVDILIDIDHVVESIKKNFGCEETLGLGGTIQFASSLQRIYNELNKLFPNIFISQARPLSKGETLGCTAPNLQHLNIQHFIFIADGRFHLESVMIQNPSIQNFYKYDPYNKVLSKEKYNHQQMYSLRKSSIDIACRENNFGIILGSLGRQGNINLLMRAVNLLRETNKNYMIILLSEITPTKLNLMKEVRSWVQIACPRLSIDWGHHFTVPLLSTFELEVVCKKVMWENRVPMDFYSSAGGPWSNHSYFITPKNNPNPNPNAQGNNEGKKLLPHQRIRAQKKSAQRPQAIIQYE